MWRDIKKLAIFPLLKRPPSKGLVVATRKHVVVFACFALAIIAVSAAATNSSSPSSKVTESRPHVERIATVDRVVDGDTINFVGGEKVRLVGVNTPELDSPDNTERRHANEAKEFVEGVCPPGTEVGLDIDDARHKDRYGRTLAVVLLLENGKAYLNLNAELLRLGLAVILYIPPSEYNPYKWAS